MNVCLYSKDTLKMLMVKRYLKPKEVHVLLVMITTFTTAESMVCLSCVGIPSTRDCSTIVGCSAHSTCYTDQIVEASGRITYTIGCKDTVQCMTPVKRAKIANGKTTTNQLAGPESGDPRVMDRRNGITICRECCTGNLCNTKLCGESGYPIPHGPICYACDIQHQPSACNQIKVCGRDEHCYIEEAVPSSGIVYTTGCRSKITCAREGLLRFQSITLRNADNNNVTRSGELYDQEQDNKRYSTLMKQCCAGDMCNDRFTGWSDWSSWSPCTVTCGGSGSRTRARTCRNSITNQILIDCDGHTIETDHRCADNTCDDSLQCLSCDSAIEPRDCNYVETCGPHSACGGNRNSFKRFLTSGNKFGCSECCSGDLCNSNGCGSPDYLPTRGPICYSCLQQKTPEYCNKISVCRRNEVCYLSQLTVVDTFYQTGCVNRSKCMEPRQNVTYTDMSACSNNCGTDLCNNNLQTPNTTQHHLMLTPSPVTVPHFATPTPYPVTYHHHGAPAQSPQPGSFWASWSSWTECDSRCGVGSQIRSRNCTINACPGAWQEVRRCDVPCLPGEFCCPKHQEVWSSWERWGRCSSTDTKIQGVRERFRYCENLVRDGNGINCGYAAFQIDQNHCVGSVDQGCKEPIIRSIDIEGSWTNGGFVILHCNATGDPFPNVHWKPHNFQNALAFDGDPSTIYIPSVDKTYVGVFTCYASNKCGPVATHMNFNVGLP